MTIPGLIPGAFETHLKSQSASPEALARLFSSLSGPSTPYRPRFGACGIGLVFDGSKLWQVMHGCWGLPTVSCCPAAAPETARSEEHTSELQSRGHLVCRLLLEKKKTRAAWRGASPR